VVFSREPTAGGGVIGGIEQRAGAVIQQALLGDALEQAKGFGAFVLDDRGRYIAVNDAACELSGYARDEIVGLRIGAFNPHLAAEYAAGRTGAQLAGQTWIARKDGTRLTLEYRASETRVARMPYLLVICWPAG
jgi:PAS domain S-box-containing protein